MNVALVTSPTGVRVVSTATLLPVTPETFPGFIDAFRWVKSQREPFPRPLYRITSVVKEAPQCA